MFPKPEDVLALTPEDLGGVIIAGPSLPDCRTIVRAGIETRGRASVAEAISWLVTEGLLVPDPGRPSPGFYVPTRRAQSLKTRTDVEVFCKGSILPCELLPMPFAEKVVPLFRRGDHDVAVFQAFKEVEVAVRNTANATGADYPDFEVGTTLMRKAFHPETGPLADKTLIVAEREAEMHLFAAALGHAKNPTSHRDVAMTALEAARLIVFASHLFDIVKQRK